MNAEEQIEALGLELPPPKPGGVYQPLLIHDGLAYVSGHGPLLPDETYLTGKVEVNWVWMRGGLRRSKPGWQFWRHYRRGWAV